jgi:hypothetical protein
MYGDVSMFLFFRPPLPTRTLFPLFLRTINTIRLLPQEPRFLCAEIRRAVISLWLILPDELIHSESKIVYIYFIEV